MLCPVILDKLKEMAMQLPYESGQSTKFPHQIEVDVSDPSKVVVEDHEVIDFRPVNKFDLVVTDASEISDGRIEVGSHVERVEFVVQRTRLGDIKLSVRNNASNDASIISIDLI